MKYPTQRFQHIPHQVIYHFKTISPLYVIIFFCLLIIIFYIPILIEFRI